MINVTLTDPVKSAVKTYPKIMYNYNNGLIVAFKSRHQGTVICCGDTDYPVFLYNASWNMDAFYDYDEILEMQNA
jgi:hypothetical protein